jgi:D-alanyl-D-alanine carboxypeptidase/D-alanyl-D-alanine-endopeptidase (penicillin-binding protein 4)
MNTDEHRFLKVRRKLFSSCFYLCSSVFICGQLFLFSCSTQSNQNTQIAEQPAFEVPAAQIDLLKPLVISDKPEDVTLAKKIDELIDKSEFANARWGIFAISLKDGRVIVARDAQKLFNPASVQKIITSTVALDKLGADFRWRTRVLAEKSIENGTLDGDLILYGEGAPDFNTESVETLANQLQAKGLKRVKGNIVGDESYFKGDGVGEGWSWNDLQWYYGAQASALTVNYNRVTISLQDGKPKIEPATNLVEFSGDVKPLENGETESVGVKREIGANKVYLYGSGRYLDARLAVENPALWSAQILKDALERKGIVIEGAAKSSNWESVDKTNAENAAELASIESQTLGEIIRQMNKNSINLYAELILRTLGKKFGEQSPDENPAVQKTRGDDSAGISVIKKWLTENGATFQETESLKDGSGLSRLNFVTPETIARALIAASRIKAAETFRNSLPIAGTDGTLGGRLGNARGKILAKTGTIMYVNSLAGYAKTERETIAFVILCNNETRKADSSILIDKIAVSLLGN